MPYLKEGEEGEKEGRRDRALPSSQRQLPQRYHLQILKWSYERLIYTICWFGFIGQELLILGFWRTRIVDSTQIENQHSGRRMTFWKYTFPLCWSETTKWVTESTKWEYISTKWATETAKGVTETTKWESKKQQSGQRVLYLATIAFNGFRWFRTINQTMRWFRWIVVVYAVFNIGELTDILCPEKCCKKKYTCAAR